MDFSYYLEQYLDARDKLAWERGKSPPSERAVAGAEEDFARAARYIEDYLTDRVCQLAAITANESASNA